MSPMRHRRNVPDILTSALFFFLLGPPIGGALWVFWHAALERDSDALRALMVVPIMGYVLAGPAAAATGALAGWWLSRLHEMRTLGALALAGGMACVLTWACLGLGGPGVGPVRADGDASPDSTLGAYAVSFVVAGMLSAIACTALLRRWLERGRITAAPHAPPDDSGADNA